jgi:alcohol dehydrogenase
MMKAAVYRSFGGPIRVENVPVPVAPQDGVVIQVMATGVCRSDWHGWKGHDDDVKRWASLCTRTRSQWRYRASRR